MQIGVKILDFGNFHRISFKIRLFSFLKVSSHRYETPSDAIEVISPASSPAPPQEKLQAYQPEVVKANQAESMSFLDTNTRFHVCVYHLLLITCPDNVKK